MLGPLGRFPERRLIVGMNSLDEFFGSRQAIPWIKTQNAVAFLRPIPDVGVGIPGPTARVAESLRLRQISLAPTEFLLRPLALGDVDHRTDEFMQIAGSVEDRTAYDVNVPDSFVRMNDSVIQFKIRLVADRALEPFPGRGLIIWVNFLKEFFASRHRPTRIETQHAIAF